MKAIAIVLIVSLSGCANYRPLIDTRGVDMSAYESDLRDCQQYAQQAMGPGTGAAVGAVAGALLGLALSVAAGSRYDVGATARVGAVAGAASGIGSGASGEMNVIRRCLSNRGYSVLQ